MLNIIYTQSSAGVNTDKLRNIEVARNMILSQEITFELIRHTDKSEEQMNAIDIDTVQKLAGFYRW